MTIYHIEFAKTGKGVSGGETWMLEVIKYFQSKGLHNVLLTTDNSKETYEKMGFKESKTLTYKVIDSYKDERRMHVFMSYIKRIRQALRVVKDVHPQKEDVLMCHSEFFPNTIPAFILARRSPARRIIYMFHMQAPSIFKGYEGHFTGRFQFPKLKILHYNFNQWLFYKLMPKAAVIVTSNPYYADILHKKCPKNTIYAMKRFAGADEFLGTPQKAYDILWIGRFHAQKGLLELPTIIAIIKQQIPDVKVIVIGDGDPELKRQFMMEVNKRGLRHNIEMRGYVMGDEKYRYIKQSKLFLMTSFYESLGIVNIEALKNGVPIVAYDMPVYKTFTGGMIKVPMLDKGAMASHALELLTQPVLHKAVSHEAYRFGKNFSWNKTGEELYQLLSS